MKAMMMTLMTTMNSGRLGERCETLSSKVEDCDPVLCNGQDWAILRELASSLDV